MLKRTWGSSQWDTFTWVSPIVLICSSAPTSRASANTELTPLQRRKRKASSARKPPAPPTRCAWWGPRGLAGPEAQVLLREAPQLAKQTQDGPAGAGCFDLRLHWNI